MTHEFADIVKATILNQQKGVRNALATVVYLEGSSYRQPGVRMLICEDGKIIGALSGGCVEKEVKLRSESVFKEGISKVIAYNGRYRLGCEGILYILIEPFFVSEEFISDFQKILEKREEFKIQSYFQPQDDVKGNFGSIIKFSNNARYQFNSNFFIENLEKTQEFIQLLKPRTKLLIIGGEHDAVKLCRLSGLLGWEVNVITSVKDQKSLADFPGASSVIAQNPEVAELKIDSETAVVLMNHNYVQDLKFLLKIIDDLPQYIGILGSGKRGNQLQNDLFHYRENLTEEVLSAIHSPAGLNIGAITPEEIAVSIISEILTVLREKKPYSLKTRKGKIHIK